MTDYHKYMQVALEEARQGIRDGQTPFGACLVRDGDIIARGHNAVWRTPDITAHAEIQTIRRACRELGIVDFSGATIYSTCEPCPMCFSAIHWARISRIVYGASIRDAEDAGFNELNISNQQLKFLGKLKVEIIPDVLSAECRNLFAEWKSRTDNSVY